MFNRFRLCRKDEISFDIVVVCGNKVERCFDIVAGVDGALHIGTPSYLSERLHLYVPSRTLRSSSSANLYVPRTNLHFGSRSFHIAAPTVWNSLLSTLRSSQTLNAFGKHLKPIFYSLHLIAPSHLSSASDSFY